ncbi:DNA mismatch repair protein Mlh1-like [Clytia hemisphaerica]|uniref:DNA mismatch repair protein Mlh1-like n=1 Tax=Clytia hemisphaerica TaxID=252671 RepID=UPI0034D551FB
MASNTPKIQKLDEVVVNRIAAGEVIQRPANAIKEMIENSLDAKSKSIQVIVKDGGLKLLQIQDDGCGIRKEDMHIVCERFTTSKLASFDDLKSIATYGFRGEALASISHVAHLTITTKTGDSPCAFKAKYEDGKMVPLQVGGKVEAKACAGNKGTQITVEDLFYNVAVRRKALRNTNEEHAKIVDVISKYAIHNPSVGFSLKKVGNSVGDVRTSPKSTVIDNIKTIYGPTLSKELLEVTHEDTQYAFKMHAFVSNANYSIKKCTLLLFINHRLVESTALRKALDAVYVNYLPKDKHPFMYMSLELNPINLDVNVHPTKHEVKFLHEEAIIESIQKCVETKLLGSNESRQYYTQSLIPKMLSAGVDCPVADIVQGNQSDKNNNANEGESEKKKLYAHQMVRTDAREQKIEAFFPYKAQVKSPTQCSKVTEETVNQTSHVNKENVETYGASNATISTVDSELHENEYSNTSNQNGIPDDQSSAHVTEVNDLPCEERKENGREEATTINLLQDEEGDVQMKDVEQNTRRGDEHSNNTHQKRHAADVKQPVAKSSSKISSTACDERTIKLTSIRNLKRQIEDNEHLGVKKILEEHKFVGCVNRSLALMQHLTQLYLVNVQNLSQELFYEIIIFRFGNFGYLELSEPAPIFELVRLVLDTPESGWEPEDGEKDELAKYTVDLLKSKADMLMDYFSVEINEQGELTAIPLLLSNYTPNWNKLPLLMLRLASEVDWDNEQQCFHDFATELSDFYSTAGSKQQTEDEDEGEWKHQIEHLIFPALRNTFIPPKRFSNDGCFLEVANLPDLYKVFERC